MSTFGPPIDKDVSDFAEKCLDRFVLTIKDRVFLMIQNDRDLMAEYLDLVRAKNPLLNADIGRAISQKMDLEEVGECVTPTSTLIGSYTQHRLPRA